MRTIELDLEQPRLDEMLKIAPLTSIWSALGYLQMWSLSRYDYVGITTYADANTEQVEFVATYRDIKQGVIRYQIGAVWNKASQTFGFHS